MTIHAFDFDGTLTKRDTLIAFIRYVKGNKEFIIGFLKHLHLLVMMKVGLMPNWKTKRIIFQYFFGGMPIETFNQYCEKFAKEKASLLRKKGMAAVNKAVMDGDQVVIISASVENWVKPFFTPLLLPRGGETEASPRGGMVGVSIIGTQIQVVDGKLTGYFLTKNCYGEEKVRRLLEQYPDRRDYKLVAYGDSRGDVPLLDFADEGHYREF
ncbi:MAG: HAD-IB family phosphatase [Prevotella sp.]|nr:HAD-IB family phosphatase [Prevotella sp.]